jgi:aryl-alcohol dehydrogenase-like predicted oxidoreductase
MQAVEDSLRRLKTDWIDLYQFHRPDPRTPIDETLRALDDLIAQGKVRYIGCSNMAAWSVVDAQWTAEVRGFSRFISAQDEYSALHRAPEADLIPALKAKGMGLLPYYPLASGLLSGKYKKGAAPSGDTRFGKDARTRDRYLTEENWSRVEKLDAFVKARGRTLLELAFSWLAAQDVVGSVIAGATKPEQIAANAAAASWKLTAEELAEVDRLTA